MLARDVVGYRQILRGAVTRWVPDQATEVTRMHIGSGRWLLVVALAVAGCSQQQAAPESQAVATTRPDFSGVWALTDESFWQANLDAYANDIGLTPKYEAIRAKARAERHQANQTTCRPAGATAALQHGILFEMLFTPGRVTMLFEDGEIRRIYMDGRPHRSLDELRDSFMGDSIGQWEGDTLVVDTIGFPKGELWQNHGVRATINTRLVERFFLNADGDLQIDSEMTDPEIFARPYKYTRINRRQTLLLTETSCVENNRDDGTTMDLTPPPE
jgi:hypothetical protein